MKTARRRHIPTRSCVVCGTKAPKRELDRIVASHEGTVSLDPTGQMPGRGTYVCKDASCDGSNLSRGRLQHALRTEISDDNWAQLAASVQVLRAPSQPMETPTSF